VLHRSPRSLTITSFVTFPNLSLSQSFERTQRFPSIRARKARATSRYHCKRQCSYRHTAVRVNKPDSPWYVAHCHLTQHIILPTWLRYSPLSSARVGVSFNFISGTLPSNLLSSSSVVNLILDDNAFTGSLPNKVAYVNALCKPH
jgi:hypothetical protein